MRSGPEAVEVENLEIAVVSFLVVKESRKCCGEMSLSIGLSVDRL